MDSVEIDFRAAQLSGQWVGAGIDADRAGGKARAHDAHYRSGSHRGGISTTREVGAGGCSGKPRRGSSRGGARSRRDSDRVGEVVAKTARRLGVELHQIGRASWKGR